MSISWHRHDRPAALTEQFAAWRRYRRRLNALAGVYRDLGYPPSIAAYRQLKQIARDKSLWAAP